MEENKVATDSELRKRAELLVKCLVPKACEVGCEECISLVFRELVAVRDQAAICTGCGFPISKHPIHHEDETREVACYLHGREA